MARLALYLLGSPHLERDGVAIRVDTRKAIALLAYLAVTRRLHTRDALAGLLWPDYDQQHARATLRRTLSALRKALDGSVLDAERETIGLAPQAPLWVDVAVFAENLAAASRHPHAAGDVCDACLRAVANAVDLYQGDFLAGFTLRDSLSFEEWQFFEREGLRRDLARALERLVRWHAVRGAYERALPYARRWLALDRLHEPAHVALMELYAWAGERAAALRQYRELVHVLGQELGVPPLGATTRLYESIKEHQPPPPPVRGATPAPAPASARGPQRTEPEPANRVVALADRERTPPAGTAYPLLGRAGEWEALTAAYRRAGENGALVALAGEAGIGKTRLAEDFVEAARRQGSGVLAARCYPGEAGLAYGPVAAALRSGLARAPASALDAVPDVYLAEAARLVPELAPTRPNLPSPPPLEGPGAQSHFFEGVCRVLVALARRGHAAQPEGADRPGILLVDDAQWADSASLDVLVYLSRRLAEFPIVVLLAWRSGESAQAMTLDDLLASARRAGRATVVSLSRLPLPVIRELARLGAPSGASDEAFVTRLYEETEGLPFFLVEYLAALAADPTLFTPGPDRTREQWTLPGGVRELLRSRLRGVDETGWQLLTTAAVIGRSFAFDTLREASGRGEEETVSALEALIARGLVRELNAPAGAGPSYDFSHEKLRAQVYDETSLARRRLLHRRVAEALAVRSRAARDPAALAGQIAAHYQSAGYEREAATYYVQAGERARALYANAEALAHFQTALALGYPQAARLHEAIGDLRTLRGEYSAALTNYEAALALGMDPAGIGRKLSGVYARRGEWELAEGHLRDALAAWDEAGPPAERAHAFADWSLIVRQRGEPERARELAERARQLAEASGDPRAQAQAHNMLGMLARDRGLPDEALTHLRTSLDLASRRNDPAAQAAALNNLALVHAALGEVHEARELTERALALCRALGDRHREAALRNNLADLLHGSGDTEGAMTQLIAAVSILAEISAEGGTPQPEIWKLTEW